MNTLRLRRLALAVLLPLAASCSGTGSPTAVPPAPVPSSSGMARQTLSLQSSGGSVDATLHFRSASALPSSAVTLVPAPCPSPPSIRLRNPFRFPLTLDIDSFTIKLHCTPQQTLYGATFYQVDPLPKLISPIKLGDASVTGMTVTFTPSVRSVTLAPRAVSAIVVAPETSTNAITLPVAPGKTTELTSNAPNLPSGLNFTYATSSGGTMYNSACFNAYNGNVLAPALVGVPLVGIPSFYCHIDTVNGAISFGTIVTFSVTAPKPDRAIFEPDGTAQGFACTLSSTCNVPGFSIPTTYQNFIVGNVQDLRLCVPSTPNLDCNGVSGDTQGSSRTTVYGKHEFQLLVADDPTYKPGTVSNPVPWDGLFRMALSGPCKLDTNADNNNGDVPPQYTDANQTGLGPYAEFDVDSTGIGICQVVVSEDPHYIIDYTNPTNPQPRSATLNLTIGSAK